MKRSDSIFVFSVKTRRENHEKLKWKNSEMGHSQRQALASQIQLASPSPQNSSRIYPKQSLLTSITDQFMVCVEPTAAG